MVRYTDINKAIVSKLKSKFVGIEITSTNVEEGITRPSFFISFDNVKASDFMNKALDREMTVRIYYFPENRHKNKIELLNMQDDLNDVFINDNIIEIDEFTKVEVNELELDVIDKVLHCYFEIMISEDYDRTDDTPNMEELEIRNV